MRDLSVFVYRKHKHICEHRVGGGVEKRERARSSKVITTYSGDSGLPMMNGRNRTKLLPDSCAAGRSTENNCFQMFTLQQGL